MSPRIRIRIRIRRRRRIAAAMAAAAVLAELICGAVLLGEVKARPHSLQGRRTSAGYGSPAPAAPRSGTAPKSTSAPGAVSSRTGSTAATTTVPPASPGRTATASAGTTGPTNTAPAQSAPAGQGAPPALTSSPPSGRGSGASASPPVSCRTDLPLSQAPDAGYAFLCDQGSTPLTWGQSHLAIYDQGLSVLQTAALAAAVVEWQALARFQVTFTADRRAADVVVTAVPLSAEQPGYTEDGYTTVSYRCSPVCAYYHADVELSSTATLTQTDWLSTALHELGHVAGLNHVSKAGQVMYPYLTLTSPVVYADGDRAGLAILAAERGA